MEVGSVYRLEHSKLPKFVLGQIGHIRAVMVDARKKNKVSVKYPSTRSLEAFFGTSTWLMQPNLDSVYSMNLNLAETVLCNRISFEEFAARRGTRSFWIKDCSEAEEAEGCNGDLVAFVRKHRDSKERPNLLEIEAVKEEGEKEEISEEGVKKRGKKRKNPSKCVKMKKKSKNREPVEIGMIDNKDNEFDDPTSETKIRWTKKSGIDKKSGHGNKCMDVVPAVDVAKALGAHTLCVSTQVMKRFRHSRKLVFLIFLLCVPHVRAEDATERWSDM